MYDIAIIGAGCVGAAIAQRLARFNVKIALVEKDADVSMGATKANSGIIHQGYFTPRGSLKEQLSLRGNILFDEVCPALGIEYKRNGAVFCATTPKELKILQAELKESQGRKVQVELIEDKTRIQVIEPQLNDNVIAVLYYPTAGIIAGFELTIGLAEHAVMNGVDLFLEFPVAFIKRENDIYTLHALNGKKLQARTIVNAAGVYADQISRMVGDESFVIYPRRGEYILFDKNTLPLKVSVFPTPDVVSKGIVIGPTVHGNTYVGPNAQDLEDKEANNTTPQGLNEILMGGKKLLKSLPLQKNITNFAGLRAAANFHDYIIQASKAPHVIHAAGIESPGLSSCLAIAERVEELLDTACGYQFVPKSSYIPTRNKPVRLADLSEMELNAKIKQNPYWGNMICRCEHVTEAEIVEACHRVIPCTNTDMIKRRLRPGMGRCQGGFCLPKVMKIISREHNMIYEEVTKTGGVSHIVFKRMKNLCSEVFQSDQV